jgi:hypothetical protein
MSLDNFSDDLILHIFKFVSTNKNMISLIRTCKYFKKLGNEFGYLKYISVKEYKNFIKFIKFYFTPNDFLQSVSIKDIDNPIRWMIERPWPKEMIFTNCFIGNDIVDIPESPTEKLIICDLHRSMNKYTIHIDWKKFPKLKILDIQTNDIDFVGLESCKELEVIRIDLGVDKYLPNFFADFHNLKLIASTCFATEPLHFVSKQLKVCLINKKYPFTSNSEFVPKLHLGMNYTMNIQCLEI